MERTCVRPASTIVSAICLFAILISSAFAEDVITQPIRTFSGHTQGVYSAVFSPDGATVLTASADHRALLWDVETGAIIRTFSGHTSIVTSAVFSADGTRVLTAGASPDNTAKLWDAASGSCIRTFSGHAGIVSAAAFSPDGQRALTVSWDRTAKLWNTETGELIRTITGLGDYAKSAEFSSDGSQILIASGNSASLWDSETGNCVRTFDGHTSYVTSAVFSPDGTRVLTGSYDKMLKLWDTLTASCIRAFTGNTTAVSSVAFSADGTRVLSGGCDKTARIWDAATAAPIAKFTGHTNFVYSAVFSHDGRFVLTGSDDATAKLWRTEVVISVQSTPITGVAITGDFPGTTNYEIEPDGETPAILSAPAATSSGGRQFAFAKWLIDGTEMPAGQQAVQIQMDGSHTAVAVYHVEVPLLTVESSPMPGIAISGDKSGTTGYTAECAHGEVVNLAAPGTVVIDDVHYGFIRWVLDGVERDAGQSGLQVTMDADHTAAAIYARPTRTLTVESTPIAGVAITGSSPGTTNYAAILILDTVADLSAPSMVRDGRYTFVRWLVDGVEMPLGQQEVQITMDADHTAIAVYQTETPLLTVQSSPVSGITISGGKPGTTEYSAICTVDDMVSLAAPASVSTGRHYNFVRWLLDGVEQEAGQTSLQVTM
ncbi:MAG TPA: WD40 repeat domain-containing protein, partial [Planctomycetota bacterium]|nr:WD40 repeat domain-containing protein [Planctomycetota bacterium]